MADVFLSYTHSERDRLVPLVTQLTLLGLTVWFDVRIPTGTSYEEVIASELEAAKSVVVCWSQASTKSKWVRSEAAFALDQGHLVPCFLERCVLKPPFNMTQTEDISEWNGDIHFTAWRKLVERIGSLVDRPGLLDLMDALNDSTGEKLRDWAALFPNDPYCASAVKLWQARQREDFIREFGIATAQLERAVKRHAAKGRARLAALGVEMDQWISLGSKARDADRPRPNRLLQALIDKDDDGHVVDREILASALDQAKTLREQATRLDQENAVLRSELEIFSCRAVPLLDGPDAATDDMPGKFEIAAVDKSRIGRLLLSVCLAAVLVLTGLTGFLATDRSRWVAMAERYGSDLNEARRSADATLRDLRQQIAQLVADRATTEAQRDAALRQAADIQAQIIKLKTDRTSPNAVLLRPAAIADNNPPQVVPFTPNAATCTQDAGSIFDRDNLTGHGVFDMAALDPSKISEALSSCTRALDGATDDRLRRRLLAQLGRAEITSAIVSKKAGDDRASGDEIKLALRHLQMAEQKGSGYAMSILGSFYQGIPGLEAGSSDAFGPPERSQAITLYQRGADLGDASAMTNLARALLDKDVPGDFDESRIVSLLKRAETLRYPRAFEVHSNAWLDLRMYVGNSLADRRRNAAASLEQEQCLGFKDEADKAFTKSPLLISYRSGSSCT